MLSPLKKSAEDALQKLGAITDSGLSFFKGTFGKLPFLTARDAAEDKDIEHDETHYFLIPFPLSDCGYSLFTKRVLPEGVSPTNDLPKAKIFHIPSESTQETLIELLTAQISEKERAKLDDASPTADRLEAVSKEIDRSGNIVTGGLIVVGGIVAIANPLLGVGIAAKALIPSLGGKLTTHGLDHVAGWFKKRNSSANDETAEKVAQAEVKQLQSTKPEINISEPLALLDTALHTTEINHDPNTEAIDFWNTPAQALQMRLAAEAISTTYLPVIQGKSTAPNIHANDLTWLTSLHEITASKP